MKYLYKKKLDKELKQSRETKRKTKRKSRRKPKRKSRSKRMRIMKMWGGSVDDRNEDVLQHTISKDMECHQSFNILSTAFIRMGKQMTLKYEEIMINGRAVAEILVTTFRICIEDSRHYIVRINACGKHTFHVELWRQHGEPTAVWRILSHWPPNHDFENFPEKSTYGTFQTIKLQTIKQQADGSYNLLKDECFRSFIENFTTITKYIQEWEDIVRIKYSYITIFSCYPTTLYTMRVTEYTYAKYNNNSCRVFEII